MCMLIPFKQTKQKPTVDRQAKPAQQKAQTDTSLKSLFRFRLLEFTLLATNQQDIKTKAVIVSGEFCRWRV